MKWDKCRVLVTGSERTTGLVMARRFAEQGAAVVVHGMHPEEVRRAAEAARDAGAGRVLECVADMACGDQIDAMFDRIGAAWGGLDILVNNAADQGIGLAAGAEADAAFEQVLRVNVLGYYRCAYRAVRLMGEEGGAVVNLSSNCASRAIRNRVAYIASKGAIEAITRALAIDLAPKVRVNAVAPGYLRTYRWDSLSAERVQRRRANIPLGYECRAEDIADAVMFLGSSEACRITGQVVTVDGGCSVQLVPADIDG